MLNHEEIKRDHSEKGDWKIFDKINRTIAFNVLFAKKRKIISCLCFQSTNQIVKNKLFFSWTHGLDDWTWTPGRLDFRRLVSGCLDTWTLHDWTLGLW